MELDEFMVLDEAAEGRTDEELHVLQEIRQLKSELIGALIALSRSVYGNEPTYATYEAMYQGLLASAAEYQTQWMIAIERLQQQIVKARVEKDILVPECKNCKHPCGRNAEYPLERILEEAEESRNLKMTLLWCMRGIALEIEEDLRIRGQRRQDEKNRDEFICKALFALGMEWGEAELIPILTEAGSYLAKAGMS